MDVTETSRYLRYRSSVSPPRTINRMLLRSQIRIEKKSLARPLLQPDVSLGGGVPIDPSGCDEEPTVYSEDECVRPPERPLRLCRLPASKNILSPGVKVDVGVLSVDEEADD